MFPASTQQAKSNEKGMKSIDKDLKKIKGQSDSRSRSRSRSRSIRKKRERSASLKTNKIGPRIHLGRLTRNVTKDHVHEIFSSYGTSKTQILGHFIYILFFYRGYKVY